MKFTNIVLTFFPLVSALRSRDISHEQSRELQSPLCKQCESIDLVFHILGNAAKSNNAATLWTDEKIQRNVEQQNVLWADTPFTFKLKGITRQSNDYWSLGDPLDESFTNDVVGTLRTGGRKTANVFINDGEVCKNGGFARVGLSENFFPVDQFSRADYVFLCGSVVEDKNLMAHELGHWFSLAHTFQGDSCDPSNVGDGVDDTPLQGRATDATCDSTQDTCPNSPGLDPIFNYMDYSSCEKKSFTQGQINKMYDFYIQNRALAVPCLSDQVELGFDIKFDSQPSKIQLSYTTWGDIKKLTYSPIENREPVILANNQVIGRRCFKRFSMHEVKFSSSGIVEVTPPGYLALTADGIDLVRTNKSAKSYLLSLDTPCAEGDGRFRLELGFDDVPNDQTWIIVDSTNKIVADYSLTTGFGFTDYIGNFAKSVLIFEKCLPKGVFTFQLDDYNEDGINPPGYYKLFLDGKLFSESSNVPKQVKVPIAVGVTIVPTIAPSKPVKKPTLRPTKKPPTRKPTKKATTRRPTTRRPTTRRPTIKK